MSSHLEAHRHHVEEEKQADKRGDVKGAQLHEQARIHHAVAASAHATNSKSAQKFTERANQSSELAHKHTNPNVSPTKGEAPSPAASKQVHLTKARSHLNAYKMAKKMGKTDEAQSHLQAHYAHKHAAASQMSKQPGFAEATSRYANHATERTTHGSSHSRS